jgi:S1-C subfamily serine protease
VSFAIPVDAVRELIKPAESTTKPDEPRTGDDDAGTDTPPTGYLGAFILDEQTSTKGAFIQKVVPDSPADRAGLKAADLVTGINGVPTPNGRALIKQLDTLDVGAVAQITVTRGGTPLAFSITLGKPPRPVLK